LATPVYIGRLSGYLAALLDRLRVFVHGNMYRGRLTDKIGGAMAVGWFRHAGLESSLQSIVVGVLTFDMIPVGSLGCPWGAPAVATQGGTGRFDKERRHGVLDDEYGIMAAESLVKRMISLGKKIKG
jgi:multimeric flavodoxin WrbA